MNAPTLQRTGETSSDLPLAFAPSFIETQFPVSRLSKESYKERSAKNSQTLTPLGKWWGRKPLIMVRAVILGLLMPASNDPHRDRDVFLALLTMDEEGLWRRKRRNIPLKEVHRRLSPRERADWFTAGTDPGRPRLKKGTGAEERVRLQRIVFDRMSYDEKLVWCDRPEHLDGPSPEAWNAINEHLCTKATTLPELVRELGQRRFGHVPRVGDAFCGGGSVPFEAARLGCEAYGSDLNPVAALLSWGALNIVGGGEELAERVRQAQADVFDAVDRQVTEWRIEHNDFGWRADAFLYCTETTCPECGWRVPLAPSWVVGEKPRTIAQLIAKPVEKSFAIDIRSGVDQETLQVARDAGTVKQSRLECPNGHCNPNASTSIAAIRGDRRGNDGRGFGIRRWSKDDLAPNPHDVFQERLYCVRWRLPSLDALLWAEQRVRTAESSAEDADGSSAYPGTDRTSCGDVGNLPAAAGRRPPRPEMRSGPVPDWVDLERALSALNEWLEADERRELGELRRRDWLAEDRTFEAARRELEARRAAGCPKHELAAAARHIEGLRDAIAQRNRRIEALARLVPGTLYRSVADADLEREARASSLLRKRREEWQALGHIPSRAIATGAKTDEPIRTRGWTHWHHLFTPRQLLTLGLFSSEVCSRTSDKLSAVASILGLSRCADYNSKLCRWHTRTVGDKSEQTFSNQALNTMWSFAGRGLRALDKAFFVDMKACDAEGGTTVTTADARAVAVERDVWLTDPPYADAVNYHELSEYLLAWYGQSLTSVFPGWYADSKRALAVQGAGTDFRQSMVDCYRNLAAHMPDNGLQVVMFTHQDASVWADLTLILWAAGLRVTAAWTIATETDSALKEGNYVQGTVLMVLRKQASEDAVFLDELVSEVESEVERQLESMFQLDDRDDRNFSDADYQLSAYAAALRVLTKHGSIQDIDIAHQLARERGDGEANPIEAFIEDAVRTASNYLVPKGLPDHLWRRLGPEEKLYLKGLEVESHGEFRSGVYQEFARGFGVRDYRFMLRTGKANETRLKTATEFQRRELGESPFGQSLVRHALYAVWRATESAEVAGSLTWLRTELADYWPRRESLVAVLRYFAGTEIAHWRDDAATARVVAGAVENDHV